ncbi:MAG: hypothetical protein ACRDPK_01065 [Carbonactinosporaceae bacterium]
MTERLVRKFRAGLRPLLPSDEHLVDVAKALPMSGPTSLGDGVAGQAGTSIARSFPRPRLGGSSLLVVTDRRLCFVVLSPSRQGAQLLWDMPRAAVRGVEPQRRFRGLPRFRLHFTDGSWVSLLTLWPGAVDTLVGVLGDAR